MSLSRNFALGAGMMYVCDPDLGRRRRAVMRDKLLSALRQWEDAARKTRQDLSNRSKGFYAETSRRLKRDVPRNDVLTARVRSKLGRVVSHPHAVQVDVSNGDVTLSGQILRNEVRQLMAAVRRVPGVKNVEAILDAHQTGGHVPSLQGGVERTGERLDLMQERWSLATRAIVGGAGAIIALDGLAHRGATAKIWGMFGASLLVRALTDLPTERLIGVGAGVRAVDVTKSIRIHAPVDEVFSFWRNYDNFPLFMRNVREVRDLGGGRLRWRIAGPLGAVVEFDAGLTGIEMNRRLAWRSDPEAMIGTAGEVRFEPLDERTTQVMIRMSYNPPAGAIGHAVAALFGADPKSEMDEDLARMKTLIERARFPHDAAKHASESA